MLRLVAGQVVKYCLPKAEYCTTQSQTTHSLISFLAMAFAPKPGCPMCGMVATASHAPPNSPRSPSFPAGSTQPEVLWRDDNFTAYREKANPVSGKGHIIVAFKSVLYLPLTARHFLIFLKFTACMFRQFIPLCVTSSTIVCSWGAKNVFFFSPPATYRS